MYKCIYQQLRYQFLRKGKSKRNFEIRERKGTGYKQENDPISKIKREIWILKRTYTSLKKSQRIAIKKCWNQRNKDKQNEISVEEARNFN